MKMSILAKIIELYKETEQFPLVHQTFEEDLWELLENWDGWQDKI